MTEGSDCVKGKTQYATRDAAEEAARWMRHGQRLPLRVLRVLACGQQGRRHVQGPEAAMTTAQDQAVYDLYTLYREQKRAELGHKPGRDDQSTIYWRVSTASGIPVGKVKAIVKAVNERRNA
jgi:hypothetical protein